MPKLIAPAHEPSFQNAQALAGLHRMRTVAVVRQEFCAALARCYAPELNDAQRMTLFNRAWDHTHTEGLHAVERAYTEHLSLARALAPVPEDLSPDDDGPYFVPCPDCRKVELEADEDGGTCRACHRVFSYDHPGGMAMDEFAAYEERRRWREQHLPLTLPMTELLRELNPRNTLSCESLGEALVERLLKVGAFNTDALDGTPPRPEYRPDGEAPFS